MKILHTDEPLNPASDVETLWAYNGLDCMITSEVLDALLPQLDDHTSATYSFSRALQGPALEMRLRGVRIDVARKAEVIENFYEKISTLEANLSDIVGQGCGLWGFNWRSNKDLMELLYDKLGIPPIRKQGRPTVNRDALEKLDAYLIARPIVRHIESMRDLAKKIEVLKTQIDPDGRIRTSYNIGGTNTGRFSSSFSEFGTGRNLQNIEESLRSIFISDPGMKLAYFDGEQIQSRIVGAIQWNLFKDGAYLDACESGDLHTTVAKLVWPKLGWTGRLRADKNLAEQPYYRHYSRRFMCKKIGHGTNFDGKAAEISRQTRIDVDTIRDFQLSYDSAFPARIAWRNWTEQQLRACGYIVALDGRKRWFLGRRGEQSQVKDALAYDAQSSESFIVNTGLLKIFRASHTDPTYPAQILMHDHDALTIQYPEELEPQIIQRTLSYLRTPIALSHGRELIVPFGCKTGWNKGEWSKENPDGLKNYDQNKGDQRVRTPQVSILDRVFR